MKLSDVSAAEGVVGAFATTFFVLALVAFGVGNTRAVEMGCSSSVEEVGLIGAAAKILSPEGIGPFMERSTEEVFLDLFFIEARERARGVETIWVLLSGFSRTHRCVQY